MFSSRQSLTRETAESIAAQGLAFLARDSQQLDRFLRLTGLSPDQIREQVNAPYFLAAVLEHLASDESLLLVFCANASVAPESVAPALALLQQVSGGVADA